MDGAQRVLPVTPNDFERAAGVARPLESLEQRRGCGHIVGGSQQEGDLAFLAIVQIERVLNRRTGIEPRAHPSGESRGAHGSGGGGISVASEKLRAVARQAAGDFGRLEERRGCPVLAIERVAGENAS